MRKITFFIVLLVSITVYGQLPSVAAPTPPTRNAVDVISIYGESYSNISGVNTNPGWGQSTVVTEVSIEGNSALEYANFNYQGTDWAGNAQDVSAMEYLHVDIWTNAESPNVFVISPGSENPVNISSVAGSWQSLDIPMSSFTSDLTNVIQFKFDGGTGATIYLDNLYFWKTAAATGTDATLSDLQVDNVTVAGFNPNAENYSIGLVEGTATVPQITLATTTDAGATVTTITQASSIPGDATVLVTAQDGTTTKTYTVSFFYDTPATAAPTPPARNAADVVSIYGDAYSNVTLDELPTSWSQTAFEVVSVDGNDVWKLTGCEFLGMVTNYAAGIDLSAMEFMHIDYWTPDDNELAVKIVNTVDGGEDIESLGTTVTGSWQSVDIDMAGFVGDLANTEKITQILIDPAAPSLLYVDNFYFYKGTALSVDEVSTISFKAYPNPTTALWQVQSPSETIETITLFNALGKQVLQQDVFAFNAEISAKNLKSGLYFARVKTSKGSQTLKLFKQ